MKLEQKKVEQFYPIMIVLESKEEAEALMTVVGNIVGNVKGNNIIRKHAKKIFSFLYSIGIRTKSELIKENMVLKDD